MVNAYTARKCNGIVRWLESTRLSGIFNLVFRFFLQDLSEVQRGLLASSKSQAGCCSSQQSLQATEITCDGILGVCERDVVLLDLEGRHGSIAMVNGLCGSESNGLGEGVKRLRELFPLEQ